MSDAEKALESALPYPAISGLVIVGFCATLMFLSLVYVGRRLAGTHPRDSYIMPLLSILITLMFFGIVGLTMTRNLPENKDTALLLGGLIAAFTTMINYWFTHVRRPTDPTAVDSEPPPPEDTEPKG